MSTSASIQESDLEFDNGSFDSAAFTAQALSGWQQLAAVMDYALLDPGATREQIEQQCSLAAKLRFASAVVHPVWVPTAVKLLAGTGVTVGSVVGFPHGSSLASALQQGASSLLRLGARELNMVIPIGPLKSGDRNAVEHSIQTVVEVAHQRGAAVKVILEAGRLAMEEKLRAAEIAIQEGADLLQTSTGFCGSGATTTDVALLRGVTGARCGVSAAGGIRALAGVREMLQAGASRIGSSHAVEIVKELGAE